MEFESKYIGGSINTKAIKVIQRNGVPVGIFEAYIATFDIDEPDFFGERDRFRKGAFLESLADHRDRDNRQIRLKDLHDRVVGGFPIETAKEDDIGLFAIGEINLDVQQGAEMFALMRQGVLVDMSIGFKAIEVDVDNDLKLRTIEKATVFEGSVVDEPRNQKAKIVSLKKLDMDAAGKCLRDDCQLEDKDIDQILASLKGMIEDDPSKSSIELVDVQGLESLKQVETVLKKSGFSRNAANALISKIKEFKSSDQGDLGNGTDDSDQSDSDDESAVVTILDELSQKYDERDVLQKINQLHDKVNLHVEGNN